MGISPRYLWPLLAMLHTPHSMAPPRPPEDNGTLQAARTGGLAEMQAYLRADTAQHWPGLEERLLLVQGEGLNEAQFAGQYRNMWLHFAPWWHRVDSAALKEATAAALEQVREETQRGRPVSLSQEGFVVIVMPADLCSICLQAVAPANEQHCRPVHPDLMHFQSINRLRILFHEQAHAVRMLQGKMQFETPDEKHREELIANTYSYMRLIRTVEAGGREFVERHLESAAVTGPGLHLYADQPLRRAVLAKAGSLPASPAEMLEEAEGLAREHALSAVELADLAAFAAQEPFIRMGPRVRRQEFRLNYGEHVVDSRGCRWYYPRVAQLQDEDSLRMNKQAMAGWWRFYQVNPLRDGALKNVTPFSYDPARPAQLQALLAFNQRVRPPSCPALTVAEITRDALQPSGALPPATSASSATMCPR